LICFICLSVYSAVIIEAENYVTYRYLKVLRFGHETHQNRLTVSLRRNPPGPAGELTALPQTPYCCIKGEENSGNVGKGKEGFKGRGRED